MSKKILFIESDAAFAQEMAAAIESRGLQARVTGDGREGLELAKVDRPDAVVLCVELPRMSGYSVCQKFKKDSRLREIPLVLMSADATQDTFEQHRKLKARADEYLLKPFDATALLQVIGNLVELPPPAVEPEASEDVVTLDDVEELDATAEAAEAPALSIAPALSPADEDEDLRLLDEAFAHLASAPDAPPAGEGDGDAAPRPLEGAGEGAPPAVAAPPTAAEARSGEGRTAALAGANGALAPREGDLADADAALAAIEAPAEPGKAGDLAEADAALAAVAAPAEEGDREKLAEAEAALAALGAEEPAPSAHDAAANADRPTMAAIDLAVEAAAPEIIGMPPPLDDEPGDPGELKVVQDRVSELHIQLARTEEELQHALLELSEAHSSAENASRERARAEANAARSEDAARAAREEAARSAAAVAAESKARAEAADGLAETTRALSQRAAELEEARARADALALDLDGARAELSSGRKQAEAERAAAAEREEKLARRVAELEALTARHEDRVVKAYQKIKGDERIREKTRKALAIALQLLEDRGAGAASADVQPRRE